MIFVQCTLYINKYKNHFLYGSNDDIIISPSFSSSMLSYEIVFEKSLSFFLKSDLGLCPVFGLVGGGSLLLPFLDLNV